jgi:hypothetical protein
MIEWAFDRLGQDPDASTLASEWIRIYLVGLPAILLLRVAQSFLNAQHLVLPLAFGCTIGSLLIHQNKMNTIVPALGLWGPGLCVTITQFAMVSLVFLYLWIRPHHKPETWPGLSRAFILEAFQPEPRLLYKAQSWWRIVTVGMSFDTISNVERDLYSIICLPALLYLGMVVWVVLRQCE